MACGVDSTRLLCANSKASAGRKRPGVSKRRSWGTEFRSFDLSCNSHRAKAIRLQSSRRLVVVSPQISPREHDGTGRMQANKQHPQLHAFQCGARLLSVNEIDYSFLGESSLRMSESGNFYRESRTIRAVEVSVV